MLAGNLPTNKNVSRPSIPRSTTWLLSLCGLFLLTNFTVAHGQSYQGALRGSVHDNAGSALPSVSIDLVNEETNVARTTLTNDAGEYVFERVDPGKYKAIASGTGFKRLERLGIVIETQQQIALDIALEVGDVAESVVVTDQVSLIETSNPSVGQVLNEKVLDDLPNSGRSPFSLAAIVPNVIPAGNPTFNRQQDQSGSSQISLAGGPVRGNNYLLEGVPITDISNRAVIIPTIEAIQELKIQVNTYDAEAGRTGGGVFNVAGKSGANRIHGSAFAFTRPVNLQANNFFNNRSGIKKPDAPYKLYGGSIGGPVVLPRFGQGTPATYNGKDRTFFWFATEGYRMTTFLSENFRVPTALERNGDFSRSGVTIRDPATGAAFPGNVIPVDRRDPVGFALLQMFPQPTGAGNNFTGTSLLNDRADQQTLKLDHSFSENYKLSGMYAHYGSFEPVANYYGDLVSNPGGSLLYRKVHALALNNIVTINPTTVLSLRYGYNSFSDNNVTSSAGFDPANLGFASSFTDAITFNKFPRINLNGNYGSTSAGRALGSSAPSERRYYSHNLAASVSKLVGRHSFKAGADYRKLSLNLFNIGEASGTFSFNSARTGNELASLLLGYLDSDTSLANNAQIVRPLSLFINYYAGYAQDDFRVNPKLTINYGLRYEYEQGLQEQDNQLTVGFGPDISSPIEAQARANLLANPVAGISANNFNVRGGLLYAGVDGNPTQQVRPSKTKFGPRIGFAYAVNDKTTLRAGYGIFWAPVVFTTAPSINEVGGLGFASITTAANVDRAGGLSNPFPNGLAQPTGNGRGMLTQLGDTIDFVDPNRKSAYVQQYSADLQRELPGNIALTLSYVGSRGTHLQIGGIGDGVIRLNQLTPEQLALGASYLTQQVPNPFFGIIATGALSRPTVERRRLLRPFPQFGDVNMHGTSGGVSFYNSGTIKAQKRLSSGVTFLTSYTFSRMLDNIIGQSNYYSSVASNALNSYDLTAEYGLSSVDTPHRYVISGIYELPFGRNRRFLNGNSVVNKLVGGWQVNAVGTYQSGFPLNVTQSANTANAFNGVQRPNAVGGVSAETPGAVTDRLGGASGGLGYLNPAAFQTAPAYTFGNLARTIDVRSPSQRNWDIGLMKNTTIRENLGVQFRVEAINAFNTPIFRAPITTFGSASFGRITSQANFARVIQFSARLFW